MIFTDYLKESKASTITKFTEDKILQRYQVYFNVISNELLETNKY